MLFGVAHPQLTPSVPPRAIPFPTTPPGKQNPGLGCVRPWTSPIARIQGCVAMEAVSLATVAMPMATGEGPESILRRLASLSLPLEMD